jgi:hypothetical protein
MRGKCLSLSTSKSRRCFGIERRIDRAAKNYIQRKKRNRKYSSIKKLKRQMDKITSKYKTTIVKKAKAELE